MTNFVLTDRKGTVGILTLNRPEVLNAWHRPMREELIAALAAFDTNADIGAIVLTGAGDRAFGSGQDLNEAKEFYATKKGVSIGEWERLFSAIRSVSKPLVAAINGVAAGSAFQAALLADMRVAHEGVRMGQPEISSGIASTTGPWILREMLGLALATDLCLTGRMMDAQECRSIGIINRLVTKDELMPQSIALAESLAAKPRVAMRLTKQRLREVTEPDFRSAIEAGARYQSAAFASGEPTHLLEKFLAARSKKESK